MSGGREGGSGNVNTDPNLIFVVGLEQKKKEKRMR